MRFRVLGGMYLADPGQGSTEGSYRNVNERSVSTNYGEPESKWQGWRGNYAQHTAC